MVWIEADSLPEECAACREKDCYNCDSAQQRWQLSRVEELRLRRRALEAAQERIRRQIQAIDDELMPMTDSQRTVAAIQPEKPEGLFKDYMARRQEIGDTQ